VPRAGREKRRIERRSRNRFMTSVGDLGRTTPFHKTLRWGGATQLANKFKLIGRYDYFDVSHTDMHHGSKSNTLLLRPCEPLLVTRTLGVPSQKYPVSVTTTHIITLSYYHNQTLPAAQRLPVVPIRRFCNPRGGEGAYFSLTFVRDLTSTLDPNRPNQSFSYAWKLCELRAKIHISSQSNSILLIRRHHHPSYCASV
jgi:hypothetical protein